MRISWIPGAVLLALLGGGLAAHAVDIAPVGSVRVAAVGSADTPVPEKAGTTTATAPNIQPVQLSKPAATAVSKPAAEIMPAEAAPAEKTVASPVKPTRAASSKVNSFNRLLKPASKRNPPPARDGIHDPGNDGTHLLQPPKESFSQLPTANSGNRVDWVAALGAGHIGPRYDRVDPDKKPIVLDLNIVREVKGSMPDVVYPHKQHTEWLDCSNCHPAIFLPKKGANSISMASILLGEKCGVCHGKVAFPVSECRKCHSKNKPPVAGK
ncbi:MAG: cytochrome c, class I [Gammaproteobacteria bacterium]|nr:cytochrome c, class I [Gammaproteobacteria bacterium]